MIIIKDLGARIETVWNGLRPGTKDLIVGALQSGNAPSSRTKQTFYDAHADWEVSRLLAVLDEQSNAPAIRKNASKLSELSQLADTCARVLEDQTASAEVFIQLAERALKDNDYSRLDKLSDRLAERFASAEIAEIVRQTEMPQIRAIAYETLAMLPVGLLAPLLDDPLYSGIAIASLEQKAFEFDSDEARDLLDQLEADPPQFDQ
jgi:hypothetical protein